jgi:hypothetical protein
VSPATALPPPTAAEVAIAKFWAAPRAKDYAIEMGDPNFMRLDHPIRIEAMQTAHDLGMIFMVHVADQDTWFATRYRDWAKYGTKKSQYEPFEKLLDRFTQPWIAAHMGGWPEDYAASGVPVAGRGAAFDAVLETLRRAWSGALTGARASRCGNKINTIKPRIPRIANNPNQCEYPLPFA